MTFAVVTTGPKKGQVNYLHIPLPIQAELYERVFRQIETRILFGGAAGVSKSHGLRWLAHIVCLRLPGASVLLLRRKFTQLERNHLDDVAKEAPTLGAEYVDSKRLVRYGNASRLQFGHCAEKGDEVNYLSDEYDLILFDEQTTFEVRQLELISSRARTSTADRPDWQPVVVGGTNPGGISAQYCREQYIDKNPDRQKYPNYKPELRAYIAGTLDDNPYLNEAYEASLMDMPEELRRAYRYGDWNIFEGQYFGEWRASMDSRPWHVVPTRTIRAESKIVCAVDWGYVKPGICLWIELSSDGHAHVCDEYVFTRTIASDVAKEIVRRTKALGVKVHYTVGDTAMWSPEGQTGESIAETFTRHKVSMVQADKDRVNGWQRLRHWLRTAPDGTPWMTVSKENCPYAARTIPALLMDAHKPEDVDTDGEDHAGDALRYFAMSRVSPGTVKSSTHYAAGTFGALKDEAKKAMRRMRRAA